MNDNANLCIGQTTQNFAGSVNRHIYPGEDFDNICPKNHKNVHTFLSISLFKVNFLNLKYFSNLHFSLGEFLKLLKFFFLDNIVISNRC